LFQKHFLRLFSLLSLTKSSRNTTAMVRKQNTLRIGISAHLTLKTSTLSTVEIMLSPQESESQEISRAYLLELTFQENKDKKLRDLQTFPLTASQMSLKVLTMLLENWPQRRRSSSRKITSSSRRVTDSWNLADASVTGKLLINYYFLKLTYHDCCFNKGLNLEVFSTIPKKHSLYGWMRKINSESFPCKTVETSRKCSRDLLKLILLSTNMLSLQSLTISELLRLALPSKTFIF